MHDPSPAWRSQADADADGDPAGNGIRPGSFLKILAAGCSLFLLAGCFPVSASPPSVDLPAETEASAVCGEPGTVERKILDSPTQGYDYEYELYLPPCYEAETDRDYPVLFLIPGRGSGFQAWFDAGAARVADEMIHAGEMPPLIIVATSTTDNDPQADLIHDDLVPYIDGSCRVKKERRYHAAAGGSLGGVAAYRIVFRDPDRFASAGIFGNGATSGEEEKIRGWLAAMNPSNKTRVFLNVGFSDDYMLGRAKVLISILDEYQIPHEEIFSAGGHSYSYWVANLPAYYKWLAEDWR
jgi:enterochelin esterase-like enzyme